MTINQQTGNIKGAVTNTTELIEYLQGHQEVYGVTDVRFEIHGTIAEEVQFEHFANVLVIDIREEIED